MIGASKILTVSYGTFSCTLEGFDDPFNTMRAIAEYFRDLAAEDRYFGAEPPTPDAAMLHRIAEREINRRVEANIQENGVILRAGDVEVTKSPPSKANPALMPAALAPSHPVPAMPVPAITVPAVTVPAEDDSVATRLSRLRHAQAAAEQATTDLPATGDEDESDRVVQALASQAEPWGQPTAEDTIAAVIADLDATEPDAPPLAVIEVTAAQTVAPDTEDRLVPVEQVADIAAWPLVDDVALSDFEVLENDAIPAARDDALHADLTADPVAKPSEIVATIAAEPQSDDAILRAALGSMIDPEGDDAFDTEVLAKFAPVETARVETVGVESAGIDAALFDAPAIDAAVFDAPVLGDLAAKTPPHDTAADRLAGAPDSAEHLFDAPPADLIAPVAAAETAQPAPAEGAQALQVDTLAAERIQRARARVIKIRRIDVGSATGTPDAGAVSAPRPKIVIAPPVAAGSELSPEAEAELQRELADLEADLSPAAGPAERSGETPIEPAATANAVRDAETPAAPLAEPQKPTDQSFADDAVNRLISQTNAAMEGPENKRRLAAIAHLKAAVAATFADRKSNAAPAQPGPEERMDPYREDLDRVVRPRRPALVAPGTPDAAPASARPQMETRPAPLVLVSEQRIDRPAAQAAKPFVAPVRPRRVTTDLVAAEPRMADRTTAAATGTDGDDEDGYLTADDVNNIFADPTQPFAEFAERLGAVTMPDLMEAAAAYCELQLGRDQFTRPLLLQQIADLPEGSDFNREDCLRGFGTLLRDGRIQKIKRGQFKLSGQSRYLAEAKRLAG